MPGSGIDEAPVPGPLADPRGLRRILLVNANRFALQRIESFLTLSGYQVTAVSSFDYAKQLLNIDTPDLLVADVRLEAFNGLHLAARSRVDHPGLPVIITNSFDDLVLDRQARDLGAVYVVNPLENPEFIKLVRAALDHSRRSKINYL